MLYTQKQLIATRRENTNYLFSYFKLLLSPFDKEGYVLWWG